MNKNKNKKVIIATILTISLSGLGIVTYRGFALEREKQAAEVIAIEARIEAERVQQAKNEEIVKEWENKIYPGVTMMGLELSGLTRDQAKAKLDTQIIDKIKGMSIKVIAAEKSYALSYGSLDIALELDSILDTAMKVGKDLDFEAKLARIGSPKEEEIAVSFQHNAEKIVEFVGTIKTDINQEAKNATITRNDGNFVVTPHADGLVVDDARLIEDIATAIMDIESDRTITAEIIVSHPTVTSDILKKINGQMSTYTTNYGTSTPGRKFNVALAASRINGEVIMPGETFSYLEGVGNVSLATGFKEAGIFVGNKIEQGVGGGLCQVSSTLYQAGLHANVGIAQRRNHSMAVSYLNPGMDAVVYAPSLDLKLTNNYSSPIYIYAYGANGKLTISFYGNTTEMGGKTYKVYSEVLTKTVPEEIRKPDDTKFEGEEEIIQNPMTGYTSKTYRQTLQNGKVIKTEVISQDSYKKVDKIIMYGTKKKAVEPTPAPTPIPPTTPTEPPVGAPPATPAG